MPLLPLPCALSEVLHTSASMGGPGCAPTEGLSLFLLIYLLSERSRFRPPSLLASTCMAQWRWWCLPLPLLLGPWGGGAWAAGTHLEATQ